MTVIIERLALWIRRSTIRSPGQRALLVRISEAVSGIVGVLKSFGGFVDSRNGLYRRLASRRTDEVSIQSIMFRRSADQYSSSGRSVRCRTDQRQLWYLHRHVAGRKTTDEYARLSGAIALSRRRGTLGRGPHGIYFQCFGNNGRYQERAGQSGILHVHVILPLGIEVIGWRNRQK